MQALPGAGIVHASAVKQAEERGRLTDWYVETKDYNSEEKAKKLVVASHSNLDFPTNVSV